MPEATAPDPFTSWDEQATREGDVVACDYTSETPGLLAPGQWRISWLSPVAGVIAQCEVKLNEGENWSGFSLGVAGCVTNPLGFLFPDS